jgi:hypothetical protein
MSAYFYSLEFAVSDFSDFDLLGALFALRDEENQ